MANYEPNFDIIDLASYTPEIELTTKGHEGTYVLSPGNEDSTFADNRKFVFSLNPLPLLYATFRRETAIQRRPPVAQMRQPRRGVRSQARRYLPLSPRGGRW
jgi:hypothetical protein